MQITREQIAAELAERVGRAGRFKTGYRPAWFDEELEMKANELVFALRDLERAGKIILVTDDVAAFRFPVEKVPS